MYGKERKSVLLKRIMTSKHVDTEQVNPSLAWKLAGFAKAFQ